MTTVSRLVHAASFLPRDDMIESDSASCRSVLISASACVRIHCLLQSTAADNQMQQQQHQQHCCPEYYSCERSSLHCRPPGGNTEPLCHAKFNYTLAAQASCSYHCYSFRCCFTSPCSTLVLATQFLSRRYFRSMEK